MRHYRSRPPGSSIPLRTVLAGAALALLGATETRAQQLDPMEYLDVAERADEAFRSRDWAEAAALYTSLAATNPARGEIWERLARVAERQDRPLDAIEALEKTIELGHGRVPVTALRIARMYAELGEREAALDRIAWALDNGLEGRDRILQDPRFRPYENDARFRQLAGLLPEREFSDVEGWRYDLEYLVTEIRRLHAAFERPAHTPEFHAAVERLRRQIPELSGERIVLEMQRLMAMLGDGHSGIRPVNGERVRFTSFPIDLYLFSDGLFVTGGATVAEGAVGSRVVAIGSWPVEELLAEVEVFVSRDNAMGVVAAAPSLLARPVVLHALGAIESPQQAIFTLESRDGARSELALEAGPYRKRWRLEPPPSGPDPLPLYMRHRDRNIWLEELPDLAAIYVQYNQVRNVAGNSIAEFADTLLAVAERSGATSIIVDARLNGGGNNFLNWPLVRGLIRFEGAGPDHRIYLLAGRHTFSAAQNFSNWVERFTDATFVGEPTGSRPNFTGETTPVVLRFSGVRGSISSRYWQDSHATDERIWIAPEVPARLGSEDYFANRDPVLQTVLNLLAGMRTRID